MPNSGVLDLVDASILSAELVVTIDGKQVTQFLETLSSGPVDDFFGIPVSTVNFHQITLAGTLYNVKKGHHTLKIEGALLDSDLAVVNTTPFTDGVFYFPECGLTPVIDYDAETEDAFVGTATPLTFPVGYLDLIGDIKKAIVKNAYSNSNSDSYNDNDNEMYSDSDSYSDYDD